MRSGKVETAQLGLITVTNTDGLPNGSVIFDTDQRINVSRQSKTISMIEDEGFPTVNLSGIYWTNNKYDDTVNDTILGNSNQRYYFPFYLPANLTCDGLRTTVTEASISGLYSVAIYNSNTNGLPQNKVLEHLAIPAIPSGHKDLSFTQMTLKKGLYWVVYWRNNNSFDILQIQGFTNALSVLGFDYSIREPYTHFIESVTYNTGSFPATAPTFTLADRGSSSILLFGLRIA